jgi:Putative zinc- or iron-chelating domain
MCASDPGQALAALPYFQQLQALFAQRLNHFLNALPGAVPSTWLDSLLGLSWQTFDLNVARQSEGLPAVDCHRGCATCCTLRVTATGPEVLMIARFIRAIDAALKARGVDLPAQIAAAHADTQGLSEQERVSQRRPCPFIAQGVCVIYAVRPLACRGLASYDRKACARAASGKLDAIPYAEPPMQVRSLVQNALQAALRQTGLSWGSYELNGALSAALQHPESEAAWLRGDQVWQDHQVSDIDAQEMARTFDAIAALDPGRA